MSSISGPCRITDRITYVFIDGNYVRKAIDVAMNEVFAVPGDLAPDEIGPSNSFRTYFYDCLDDLKRASETEAEFRSRVDAQNESFERTRPGLHLRLGTLKGGRRRMQKEVDVLLAVDMLTHGFNRNMTHAILISGDLDFRPVVETLVRSGVFVEVWYEKRTGAKELPGAADFGTEITWETLYRWNTESFKSIHRQPAHKREHQPILHEVYVASGKCQDQNAELIKAPGRGPFILHVERPDGVHWFEHDDRQILERYIAMLYGAIQWK